jgi:hypothetical protein
MTKLPRDVRDFLIIWAIGSILGVTKDVDMVFTRQHNRPRMEILMLDPKLIPSAVDIVIGDNVYELNFKAEPEDMQDHPTPLEMEDDGDEFEQNEDKGADDEDHHDPMQEDTNKEDTKLKGQQADVQGKNVAVHVLGNTEVVDETFSPLDNIEDLGEYDDVEGPIDDEIENVFEEDDRGIVLAHPEVEEQRALAAIPEAVTPTHSSRRRAESAGEHSLDRAERIKAAHNLDFRTEKGNLAHPKSPLRITQMNML